MSKNPAISLRSLWLGSRLKAARLAAGMTLEEAGNQLQLTDGSLSRFEKGTTRVRRPYVKVMIDLYAISSRSEREALLRLNEDAWRKDWWDGDTSDLDMEFIDYTWLESRANRICHFSMLIPGLLQTREHAKAIMQSWGDLGTNPKDFDRLLDLREQRQQIFEGDEPKHLSVVLEETVLYRVIGDKEHFATQLRHLLDMNERSHINIQVRKYTSSWAPGLSGPFTYFDMTDPYPNVAYIDNLVGQTFIEETAKTDRFRRAYDRLRKTALSTKETNSQIRNALKDLE